MFITTKIVVGKLGYHELAAVGIAGDLSFEILIIFMAMLSVVGVLVAQAEGGGKREELGHAVHQGIFVATLIGIPAMIGIWNLDHVLIMTGQEQVVIELAIPYLKGVCGMVLPVVCCFQKLHCRAVSNRRSNGHHIYRCFAQLPA